MLTDGVQVVLSKCIRRTDQGWSKLELHGGIKPILEAGSLPPIGQQKRRHSSRTCNAVWPKHWKEDVVQKKGHFPEPMEIPAPLEITVEAVKRDGGERKPSGEYAAESALHR